jgi:hypothetical protein
MTFGLTTRWLILVMDDRVLLHRPLGLAIFAFQIGSWVIMPD